MEFITERLILRPWQESDAERLFEYAKDPEVGPIAGWPVHTSVENSLDIIRNVLSVDETYAVCLKDDNRAIGSVGLIPPMQSHTKAAADEIEIGYWLGVPFWGNGYISEAVKRLQQHAFEDLGCNAMWCGYYDGNEKSKRCQEKCGFIYHHTEENKPCELMGDVRKEHFTRLTKEDWVINKPKKPVVLFVHGRGGSATEADHYRKLFPGHEVVGFDYQAETPWDCINEFQTEADSLLLESESIILVAHSIGAFFAMHALSHDKGTFRLSCSLFHGPLHHHLAQSQHSAQLTDTATGFLLNLSDQLISLVYRQFSQIPVFGVLAEQISQSFICPSRF